MTPCYGCDEIPCSGGGTFELFWFSIVCIRLLCAWSEICWGQYTSFFISEIWFYVDNFSSFISSFSSFNMVNVPSFLQNVKKKSMFTPSAEQVCTLSHVKQCMYMNLV